MLPRQTWGLLRCPRSPARLPRRPSGPTPPLPVLQLWRRGALNFFSVFSFFCLFFCLLMSIPFFSFFCYSIVSCKSGWDWLAPHCLLLFLLLPLFTGSVGQRHCPSGPVGHLFGRKDQTELSGIKNDPIFRSAWIGASLWLESIQNVFHVLPLIMGLGRQSSKS